MRVIIFLVFLFLLNNGYAQPEISPDMVWKKCIRLYQEGKLDSTRPIIYFTGKRPLSKTGKREFLYCSTDTVRWLNGHYSVGKLILDPAFEFNFLPVGYWQTFYPNGQLFYSCNYALGAYSICQGGGPAWRGYAFRCDSACFFYPNGGRMAAGKFNLDLLPAELETGSPLIYKSTVTNRWDFFDECGYKIAHSEGIREQIDQSDYFK